jgi:hypothetical protein
MPSPRINLSGRRFGRLVAEQAYGKTPSGQMIWNCRCDCGNLKPVHARNLLSGATRSCRCLSRELSTQRQTLPNRQSMCNVRLNEYKWGARRRNLEWDISDEEFFDIIHQKCVYCDSSPTHRFNGVDRRDNLKGYVSGNVVPCCKKCNTAKADYTPEEFLAWIAQVYRRSNLCESLSLS